MPKTIKLAPWLISLDLSEYAKRLARERRNAEANAERKRAKRARYYKRHAKELKRRALARYRKHAKEINARHYQRRKAARAALS